MGVFESNPNYVFVMDGQTLMLEDLLRVFPECEQKLRELISDGKIAVGPLYAQIDFRISPENALFKNFEFGKKDMESFGTKSNVCWMVDNFGFVSQLPQLMKIHDIDFAVIWRGVDVPKLELVWQGSDGSTVNCLHLITGYRNFYNLRRTKKLILKRLENEVQKLIPFSSSEVIPLLDGYDLETNPEDPTELLKAHGIKPTYPNRLFEKIDFSRAAIVSGELLSGELTCVFPGTLSTNVYLKIGAYYTGKLLKHLGILKSVNGSQMDGYFETFWREFLKTLPHDNICGVSVDLVNSNMVRTYRKLLTKLRKELAREITRTAERNNLRNGNYVLSFSPYSYSNWYCNGDMVFFLQTNGMGMYPTRIKKIGKKSSSSRNFTWENEFYKACLNPDGTLGINNGIYGFFELFEDEGDAYSSACKPIDFTCILKNQQVISEDSHHKIVQIQRVVKAKDVQIETNETVVFDGTPIIKWTVETESKGCCYKLVFSCDLNDQNSEVFVKMPFDIVRRPRKIVYKELSEKLRNILIHAREMNANSLFPFQGFVALAAKGHTKAVFARGLREYEVAENGRMRITLIRSVDYVAKTNVPFREGDAGPNIFVPKSRCEGKIRFELGICEVNHPVMSVDFLKWFTLFDEEMYVVSLRVKTEGKNSHLNFFSSNLPVADHSEGKLVVYNPFETEVDGLKPKRIAFKEFQNVNAQGERQTSKAEKLKVHTKLRYVFEERESNYQEECERICQKIKQIESEVANLSKNIKGLKGMAYHEIKNKILTMKRYRLELLISSKVNPMCEGKVENISLKNIWWKLNKARIEKRTHDFVLNLFSQRRE